MSRTALYTRRILIVLALAVLAQAVLAPAATAPGPYLSALSSLATVPEAAAASTCSDRVCDSTGTRCIHVHGSHYDCGRGDFCRERACL